MKKFFSEFKKFIMRGNIVDLAVAVVVGGAFGKIVTSLVDDIIMPLISLLVGGASVAEWKWVIKEAVIDEVGTVITAESALHYGSFIQTIIDFLIIAFFIFLAMRVLMNAQKSLDELTSKDKRDERARVRALKAEGKTKKEAKAIYAAEVAAKKAEEEAKAAAEEAEKKASAPPTTDELLTEIRDLLAKTDK